MTWWDVAFTHLYEMCVMVWMYLSFMSTVFECGLSGCLLIGLVICFQMTNVKLSVNYLYQLSKGF